jgi:diguanylate cyclase (GGDEF)-like protein/PAS domain S-box-containing protein
MPEQASTPDSPLDHYISLCRTARALDGAALLQALSELEQGLKEIRASIQPGAIPTAALSAPLPEPVINMDLMGYITGWNAGAEKLFGYAAEEAIGQHVLFLYADSDEEVAEVFLDNGASVMEVRRRKKSGEVFWAGLALSAERDASDQPIGLVARMSEIGGLSDQDKLRLHARIIEDSDQGILITDAEERIVSVNTAFTRITGYAAAEAIGQTPDILRSGKHNADFRAQVRSAMRGAGPWQGEIIGKRKNGELFPQSVSISVVRDDQGEITHAFSIFSDISVYKEAEARIQHLANYDSLTGLPNRSLLTQLVGQALAVARRQQGHGAILVLGLHRFTSIYDTLGNEVADRMLREVSQRFRSVLRDEDVLARLDGDHFAIGLLDIQKREHAGIVAQKLLSSLDMPFNIAGHNLRLGASVGIAVYPEDGMETATLLRFADSARTRVHQSGETGYMFFSAEMNQRAKEHLWFESELRRALAENQLQLHYQPKVSLRSGRIVGAEALLRWKHPERGMVSPGIFVPVAEETGLILDLGSWVLEEACRQIRQWKDAGLDVPPVAINISSRQFDAGLPGRVHAVLDKYQLPPNLLKLEITESLLVRGAENVIPIMNELVALGLALALDDFGTGYSSLAYLKKFPISTLKIDRSFVIGLPHEENDCAIARAIVTMGQQLRQEIVAEGVETREQMSFLRDLGCDQLQGYLFSPALPPADFERKVRDGERLTLRRTGMAIKNA